MNKNDWNKWAKYTIIGLLAVCLIFWVVIPALEIIGIGALDFLLDYTQKHPVGVFFVACICGIIAWRVSQEPTPKPPLEPDRKPTHDDYNIIAKTVYPALCNVREPLKLIVRSKAAIMVDPADRILSWGNVWGLKFKTLKHNSVVDFDVDRAKELIQEEIKSVLNTYNPSKFAKVIYPYKGALEPILQVADVEDGDAYIYIYVVYVTTDTYFLQKAADEDDNLTNTEADTDDPDF